MKRLVVPAKVGSQLQDCSPRYRIDAAAIARVLMLAFYYASKHKFSFSAQMATTSDG